MIDLTKTRKYNLTTPVLKPLHWFPVAQRKDLNRSVFAVEIRLGKSDLDMNVFGSWKVAEKGWSVKR